MRIADLSAQSGFSVATIKYYLREGLLPPGERTAQTQARYSQDHLRRLHLIRVLSEIGELPIARIRAIIEAADAEPSVTFALTGAVQYALAGDAAEAEPRPELADAQNEVAAYLAGVGMVIDSEAPGLRQLAEALVALRRLGRDVSPDVFALQLEAARTLAAREVTSVDLESPVDDALEMVAIGTVLLGAAFNALRQLAHEDEIRKRFEQRG